MIAFIDDHREAYGVEPICKVLPIAPSTYHAHIAQRVDASKRSARAQRDAELKIEVQRVFAENFGVYGVRKVWRQLRREGFTVARCTVERLMESLGLQRDPWQARADRMPAGTRTSPTSQRAGFVYVAFVIDAYARRIVCWRVSRDCTCELRARWDKFSDGLVPAQVDRFRVLERNQPLTDAMQSL
jgi:hypothetical protein